MGVIVKSLSQIRIETELSQTLQQVLEEACATDKPEPSLVKDRQRLEGCQSWHA